jgi:hypothetical protein
MRNSWEAMLARGQASCQPLKSKNGEETPRKQASTVAFVRRKDDTAVIAERRIEFDEFLHQCRGG